MKLKLLSFLLFFIPFFSLSAQGDETLASEYLHDPTIDQVLAAEMSFSMILDSMDQSSSEYPMMLEYYRKLVLHLRKHYQKESDWEKGLKFAKTYLDVLDKGEDVLPEEYMDHRYWTYKDVVVAYFGLDKLDSARIYQDSLYAAYETDELPHGIDEYYNFEKFVWNGLNIWAYEWYPNLGDPESEGSFTKIVYYIYSTKDDGSDDEQLYRLHVLKIHKIDDEMPDFVLTAYFNPGPEEIRQSLWKYTYSNPVDYIKLRKDIREVVQSIAEASQEEGVEEEK